MRTDWMQKLAKWMQKLAHWMQKLAQWMRCSLCLIYEATSTFTTGLRLLAKSPRVKTNCLAGC